jgi:hypothetical protein
MGSSTRATILDDKEAMKEIAEYVIKEIERRDRIEKRKLNKIHNESLKGCYENYGDND